MKSARQRRTNSLSIAIAIVIAGLLVAGAVLLGVRAASGTPGSGVASAHTATPAIEESDPSLGDPKAPATLVAFEDFECPFCGRFSRDTLPRLREKEVKEGALRIVWKDFPLSIHSHAQLSHEAARCAQEQGKFWEYHDLLFNNQNRLNSSDLKGYARELGLDPGAFDSCFDSHKYRSLVQDGQSEGTRVGVSGTPSFVLNGTLIAGALPYETFAQAIAQAAGN